MTRDQLEGRRTKGSESTAGWIPYKTKQDAQGTKALFNMLMGMTKEMNQVP